MISVDRAARRYIQIQAIEASIRLVEGSIEDVQKEVDDAAERLKELRKEKAELMKQLRATARDEGELPLFDLVEKLSDAMPRPH